LTATITTYLLGDHVVDGLDLFRELRAHSRRDPVLDPLADQLRRGLAADQQAAWPAKIALGRHDS
jgi:hypothetical protein